LDRLAWVKLASPQGHQSLVILDKNGASEEDGNIKSDVE
jgi:hypothetical protein